MGPVPYRFRRLDRRVVAGVAVPVARGPIARLLGLALLPRRRAGPGLLIPRCRSIHTFGMRFAIDVLFLDDGGREIGRRAALGPWRVAGERAAAAVLELPARSDVGEAEPVLAGGRLGADGEPLQHPGLARQQGEEPGDHRQC